MHRKQILGSGIILGTILVLSLVAAGVMRHRESAQSSGVGLLWTDVTLLVAYGSAGILVWKQRSPDTIAATMVGAQIGLLGRVSVYWRKKVRRRGRKVRPVRAGRLAS